MIKFKAPWHYLFWSPEIRTADGEVAIARLTRRIGVAAMCCFFWGRVTNDGRFTRGCAAIALAYNDPGFLAAGATALGCLVAPAEDWTTWATTALLAWTIGWLWGTARYVAWLIALLHRWPPMGTA